MIIELVEVLCIIVRICAVAIPSVLFLLTVRLLLRGRRAFSLYINLLVYGFYVLPLLLNFVSQYYHRVFVEANDAMKDPYAIMIYCVFVIILSIALYRTGKKKDEVPADSIEYNPYVVIFGTSFMLGTLVVTILTNGFSVLSAYGMGYFSEDVKIITPLFSCSIVFFLVILAYKQRGEKSVLLFDTLLLFLLLWIEGKRNMVAFSIIMGIFTMAISGKLKGKQVVGLLGGASISIVAFAYFYGVFLKGNVDNLRDYFAVELSRDYTLIYQIHCRRIGKAVSVNRGDALLYIILFWVPRSLWPTKPYPFVNSLTMSLLGMPPANKNLGWATTASIFSDLYDTFGILGLLIGIVLICKLCKIVDKTTKATTKVLLVHILVYSLTVQLSSTLVAFTICCFSLRICDLLNSGRVSFGNTNRK